MQFLSDNPALRSHLESQVDFLNEFSQRAFDTARQLSEMNLKLARQTIEGSVHASHELIGCTDPVQFSQTAMKQLQPATERLRSWQEHLLRVLAGAQADFTHAAEARIPEASRSAGAVADELVRHAAAGVNVPITPLDAGSPSGKPH